MERFKPEHGTTTLGFIFAGGVLLAADSRATQGSYIGKRAQMHVPTFSCAELFVSDRGQHRT